MLANAGFLDRPGGNTLPGRVVSAACSFFDLTEDQLRSDHRRGPYTQARWAIAHVLIEHAGWSLARVGALLDKDHTTILYGYRRSRELVRTDSMFHAVVSHLEQQI